jgi:hypothetical protein
MAFFSNRHIVTSKHRTFPFTGRWFESFGCPPVAGSWIIYGGSGSGKTGFALQLARYLTSFDRVLYWSIEQGNSKTFQQAWIREGMQECGNRISVADDTELLSDEQDMFASIVEAMLCRRGPGILIIDSITPLKAMGFTITRYESLRKRLKGKLLIWLSHENASLPDTNAGDYIMKLSDLKMHAVGFTVFINNRAGDRMQNFVIWEQGAEEYHINNSEQ